VDDSTGEVLSVFLFEDNHGDTGHE
jgi:hypothetical protein